MDEVYRVCTRIWEKIESRCMHIFLIGFYFSILLPFGVAVRFFADPLRKHTRRATASYWDCYPSNGRESYTDKREDY